MEHGFGYCAVTTRPGSYLIGLTGIRVYDFHGEQVLNLGYRFRPEVWVAATRPKLRTPS
jgi:hypothetical protein